MAITQQDSFQMDSILRTTLLSAKQTYTSSHPGMDDLNNPPDNVIEPCKNDDPQAEEIDDVKSSNKTDDVIEINDEAIEPDVVCTNTVSHEFQTLLPGLSRDQADAENTSAVGTDDVVTGQVDDPDSVSAEKLSDDKPDIADDLVIDENVFGWTSIEDIELPFILRNCEEYIAVRMIEMKFLSFFPPQCPEELKKRPPLVSHYITEKEADMLNDINLNHCDGVYGAKEFTKDDLVVKLDDFKTFFSALRSFYPDIQIANAPQVQGGWVQINNTVVPFTSIRNQWWLPLSVIRYAAHLVADVHVEARAASVDERNFLNKYCKQAGIQFDFPDQTEMMSLETLKKHVLDLSVVQLPLDNPFDHAFYNPEIDSEEQMCGTDFSYYPQHSPKITSETTNSEFPHHPPNISMHTLNRPNIPHQPFPPRNMWMDPHRGVYPGLPRLTRPPNPHNPLRRGPPLFPPRHPRMDQIQPPPKTNTRQPPQLKPAPPAAHSKNSQPRNEEEVRNAGPAPVPFKSSLLFECHSPEAATPELPCFEALKKIVHLHGATHDEATPVRPPAQKTNDQGACSLTSESVFGENVPCYDNGDDRFTFLAFLHRQFFSAYTFDVFSQATQDLLLSHSIPKNEERWLTYCYSQHSHGSPLPSRKIVSVNSFKENIIQLRFLMSRSDNTKGRPPVGEIIHNTNRGTKRPLSQLSPSEDKCKNRRLDDVVNKLKSIGEHIHLIENLKVEK